jgi:signal transduction histidine kinase
MSNEVPGNGEKSSTIETPSGIFRLPVSFRSGGGADLLFQPVERESDAEQITVRIRWFGLAIGALYVNFVSLDQRPTFALNAMLGLGAAYALVDTLSSWRGRLLLTNYRLVISIMEAIFIGLLCHYDLGVSSPFRFYYFLSLMVCAIRHNTQVTVITFSLHAVSYLLLGFYSNAYFLEQGAEATPAEDLQTVLMTLVFLGWVTWAVISLTGLMKKAGRRLTLLNQELKANQMSLEQRIARRTKELQKSQALLVQQEKQAAFGLLAAGIAHEVGNPLASISSIIQLLCRKVEDQHIQERLGLVDGQLQRIQRTLRELTSFSRPASEHQTPVDVHEAIQNALNIAKYYKRWKSKSASTVFAPGLPHIRTVRDQLVQVMLNLILNALDAMEEGASMEITTELIPATETSAEMIGIRLRDEGCGIPLEMQRQVFQPYFTTKDHGTGLGLFVCSHITQNSLQGELELIRSDAQGTEFLVKIPAVRPEPRQDSLNSSEL